MQRFKVVFCGVFAMLAAAGSARPQSLSPEMKAKVETRLKQLQAWSADPVFVGAVKAHNASAPPEYKAMTQEKWKSLTLLDPFVRSFTRNELGIQLKNRKDETIGEAFVSGADGTKVAFLSKTTNWSHKGKDKHEVPMKGKPWVGPVEVDESTGLQLVQVAFPVLDAGKPIGSVVVGLKASALK